LTLRQVQAVTGVLGFLHPLPALVLLALGVAEAANELVERLGRQPTAEALED